MIIERILAIVAGRGLVVAAVLGALTVLATWDMRRTSRHIETGRTEQRQKTEKANATVAKNGSSSAAGTRDPRVRGQVDPSTRAD